MNSSDVLLSDICEAIVDCEHKTAPSQSEGIPLIRTTDIENGKLKLNQTKRISENIYKNWTKRLEPQAGDIILAREAPVGEVGYVPEGQKVCLGQRTVLIRVNSRLACPRYVLYLLCSEEMRFKMASLAAGSVVPHLNMEDIRILPLGKLPNLKEQRIIADFLGALDDKININQKMNCTLEAVGEALFKRWFVDFEFPNQEGKPYKSTDGKMGASSFGEIPIDWSVGGLSDICEIVMGQSPPGETYNEVSKGIPFFQGIRDFGFRFPSKRVYCTAPTRFAEEGDVLLSVRAPVGSLNIADEHCAIGRGVAALRLKGKQNSFLYYLLLATRLAWDKYDAKGTVFGSATKQDVYDFKSVIPPKELRDRFGEFMGSLDKKILFNERESCNLTTIRDLLLPKLMSGKIRVPIENQETK